MAWIHGEQPQRGEVQQEQHAHDVAEARQEQQFGSVSFDHRAPIARVRVLGLLELALGCETTRR